MDVSCELEISWESEAGFGLLPGGTSEAAAGTDYATLFKTEETESRSAPLLSLGVSTGSQLVQAQGTGGCRRLKRRLGYQGGEIIQSLTAWVSMPHLQHLLPCPFRPPHLWLLPFSFCISLEPKWGVPGDLRLRQREERKMWVGQRWYWRQISGHPQVSSVAGPDPQEQPWRRVEATVGTPAVPSP